MGKRSSSDAGLGGSSSNPEKKKAKKKLVKSISKALEKSAAGELSLKALRKQLGEGVDKEEWKATVATAAEQSSGLFAVDGKVVRLKSGGEIGAEVTATAVKKTKKDKKSKKEKKGAEPSSASGGGSVGGGSAPDLDAIRSWREANATQVSQEIACTLPTLSFSDPRLPKDVVAASCKGFQAPTPIQAQCWPILLSQRDLIGLAETGSGKTLAFSLPGLHMIMERWAGRMGGGVGGKTGKPSWQQPMMLVVAPTRELALQTEAVAAAAAKGVGVSVACIYGGMPKWQQKQLLDEGVSIVIATPGRLRDFLDEGSINLSEVKYIVLDEADRMLDMGFLPDIRAIMASCHATARQTAMLSATWPMSIQKLASEFLTDPIKVTVGSAHSEATANVRITQVVEVVEERERDGILLKLLTKHHKSRKNRVLVFGLYKKECARLERMLQDRGWACGAVHGDKGQRDREDAVNAFKAGTAPLLIATDVAARGLDIPDVEVVINYSFPLTIEDYVHRIGRTGRAGKTGHAHTLFHVGDKAHAGELVNVLKGADQPVPEALMKFGTHTKKKVDKTYGAFFKDVDMSKKGTKTVFADD
jgi:ATP-dependent RNA helicase DBP3